jgi:two-component system chemotaxis sensor kinase CheA
MGRDVNEMVLDAFRVEHREQLEQLRTLFGSLQPGECVANDARVREAFRLAHSFKGGARVCDLRDPEQLGHGLETVLEHLSRGDLLLTKDALATVTLVLDRIEDWMTALDQEQLLPDTSDALAAIEHVLTEVSGHPPSPSVPAIKTTQLFQVFCKELEQHAVRLRQFLAHWNSSGQASDDELTEAARAAHTLAGAAAVVSILTIETAAESLEKLFRALKAHQQPVDAAVQLQIEELLDTMASTMRGFNGEPNSSHLIVAENKTPPVLANPPDLDESTAKTAINQKQGSASTLSAVTTHETVRVSVGSLDRLMRSSSEMLADNQHVARLTRQLATLQLEVSDLEREREAIRRAALPSLHQLAAMPEFCRVSRYLEFVDQQVSSLAKRTRQLTVEHRRMAWRLRARSTQLQRDVHEARLVPAHSVFQGFRKMMRDLAKSEGKEIELQMEGMDIRADRMVLQELKDPIMHVLRNCVSHGIETPQLRRDLGKSECGRVSISLEVAGGRLNVVVEDDGRGVDISQVRQQGVQRGLLTEANAAHLSTEETLLLVFEPGFSTSDSVTEVSGRGMGLSIVYDSVARLQGQVTLSPRSQAGLRATLSVPVFVSTHRVLLVVCGQETIAIPTHGIERLLRIPMDQVETMEGQPVVTHARRPVRLARLADVLGQADPPIDGGQDRILSVILLKSGERLLAVSVDALLEERDALILNLDEFAETSQLAGGILLEDGKVALVVQSVVLMENALRSRKPHSPALLAPIERTAPAKVLIVDDSFTTRTLEKNILESQGYDVSVAIDGVEALSLLRQQKFALVITDVEMPRMDGFELLEQIKSDKRFANTPVILVTSRDRQEDQQHGLHLGADAYIVKRKFDHHELLSTIRQLI